MVAGFAALPGDRLTHVASACRIMSLAGERAAMAAAGPGSFVALFLDELFTLEVQG